MRQMILLSVMCLAATGVAVAAGPDTHVGQPASQLVTLFGSCDAMFCTETLLRILPNGKMQTCPTGRDAPVKCAFTAPDGMVLVVTDVDWDFESNSSTSALLVLEFETDQSLGKPIYSSQILLTTSESFQKVHNPFTTGFVVPSKTRLRPFYLSSNHTGFWRITVYVRGYLVADK
jgi:hypothetical protein